MNERIHNLKISMLLFVIISILSGCAAVGPAFQKTTQIPENKGIVYVYRPDSILGAAVHYDVYAGNELICDLIRGGYCTYLANYGELEIWGKTEAKGSITVDVKAGQEHYIKGALSVGFLVGRPHLIIVDPSIAANEIKDCNLIIKNPK